MEKIIFSKIKERKLHDYKNKFMKWKTISRKFPRTQQKRTKEAFRKIIQKAGKYKRQENTKDRKWRCTMIKLMSVGARGHVKIVLNAKKSDLDIN